MILGLLSERVALKHRSQVPVYPITLNGAVSHNTGYTRVLVQLCMMCPVHTGRYKDRTYTSSDRADDSETESAMATIDRI